MFSLYGLQAFPGGMRLLGEYIHSKGLKYGVYSDAGEKTCAGRPGSLGYEKQDAMMYAEWEVSRAVLVIDGSIIP